MLFFDGALGLIMFGVWLFCIVDVITTPEGGCRNLPKLLWLVIVILLVDIGSILWLAAGREWGEADTAGRVRAGLATDQPRRGARRGAGVASPAESGPVSAPVSVRATNPDDDEEFLAQLRARAESQRRRAREADTGPGGDAPRDGDPAGGLPT